MSRLGNKPVAVPAGVTVTIADRKVTIKGKLGELSYEHRPEVGVEHDADAKQIVVSRTEETKPAKAFHGLTRSLIQNMVTGVTEGFRKDLEINGVGWNAKLQGKTIHLTLGYADVRTVAVPDGVNVDIQGGTKIAITGIDKQAVGQVAAAARAHRPPEPYNGKGVKYADEVIVKKEGKAFAGGG